MILNITHNDLDGIASAAVVREAFGKYEVITQYVNYFEINNLTNILNCYNIDDLELIVLTDINLKEDKVIRYMNNNPEKFLLIDHHMDTLMRQKDFEFENYINIEFCGAVNAYRYLEVENENLKEYVRLANIYDLHKKESPRYAEAEKFSDVCTMINTNTVLLNIEKMTLKEFQTKFSSFDTLIGEEYKKQIDNLVLFKDYEEVKLWNYTSNDSIITPNISNRIDDVLGETGFAHLIIYDYDKEGKRFKCSLRSDLDYMDFPRILDNCGFKGGGHKQASGVTLFDKEDIKVLLKHIKDFIKNS